MKQDVTLRTLGSGAAEELFQAAMVKVLENIADPNTAAKAKREITVKVTVVPSEDRSIGEVEIAVGTKLPARRGYKTLFFMGTDGTRPRAFENNPEQNELEFTRQGEEARGGA